MRRLVLFLVFCFANLAMACPQLAAGTATYTCRHTENKEVTQHEIIVVQDSNSISLTDREAGYTEGPFLLKTLTSIRILNQDLIFSVTCRSTEMTIQGLGYHSKPNQPMVDLDGGLGVSNASPNKKEVMVTIRINKTAKGFKSTWQSEYETIENDCELKK